MNRTIEELAANFAELEDVEALVLAGSAALPDSTQFKPVGGGRPAPAKRGRSLRGVRIRIRKRLSGLLPRLVVIALAPTREVASGDGLSG